MKPDSSRRSVFGAKADRDQQLDQALKQEMRGMTTPAEDHLDAETLAAWADRGLDETAMASVESHLSHCTTCLSIAGAMARSAPVMAVAPPRSFRIPGWWLPIAAGAAAVTIWMVVPPQREIATTPPSPAVAEPAAPIARDSVEQGRLKDQPPVREDRRERAATTAASTPQEPSAKLADTATKADADSRQLEQKNEVAAAAAAPAPPRAPAVAELQKATRLGFGPIEIVSPIASQRWRIVPGGIERSEDGGVTWVIVRPGAGEVITSGTSPTGSICWLIGRSGVVLVTIDGVTFARVPLPEAIDLASVAATDGRTATVTAVDGRRFRTDDSGRTWRQIQA